MVAFPDVILYFHVLRGHFWMCKKPVLNMNMDATLGNLPHSAKTESCFTVRRYFIFLLLLTSVHEQWKSLH